MRQLRIGIIGLGRSGWDIHAATIKNHPSFCVAAVADPQFERQSEAIAEFGCAAYNSPVELLADEKVELVVIATPSNTHAALSEAALKAGKHVLVEKPMARNVAEADEMIECAQLHGKKLVAYQPRRVGSEFTKLQEILDSGVLGPIHLIKVQVYGYQRRRDWQTLRKFAGGMLNNLGAHYVDQALSLAGGQWNDLFVDMRHIVSAGDADDHVKIVFRGAGGVVVDIELSTAAALPAPPLWTILGKYGALTGNLKHFDWKYYDPQAVPVRIANENTPERSYEKAEDLPWQVESADLASNDLCADFYDRLYDYLCQDAPSPAPPEEIRALTALFDECRNRTGF
ncbi:Gfo/Idh/MocA family oxidoreductase [bacterium]|nr:MAG: Gfo/Idh/MocA family oxidoreductase [bacterium]